jgi:hypothetical protein
MERKLSRIITGHKNKGKSIVKYEGSPLMIILRCGLQIILLEIISIKMIQLNEK